MSAVLRIKIRANRAKCTRNNMIQRRTPAVPFPDAFPGVAPNPLFPLAPVAEDDEVRRAASSMSFDGVPTYVNLGRLSAGFNIWNEHITARNGKWKSIRASWQKTVG